MQLVLLNTILVIEMDCWTAVVFEKEWSNNDTSGANALINLCCPVTGGGLCFMLRTGHWFKLSVFWLMASKRKCCKVLKFTKIYLE